MIQRRAARYVTQTYSWKIAVTPLLEQLQWDTLLERRSKLKVLCLYKIVNNLLYIDDKSELIPTHSNRLLGIQTMVDAHRFSFLPSSIRLWNNLKPTIRNCDNFNQFKIIIMSTKVHSFGFTNC